MAKGIIVVDMPEICENCLFSRTHADPLQDCLYCTVLTRGVIRKNQIKRPNWCPIKPMPEIAYRHEEAFDMASSALKEIQQYREIGTVEECREAVEKQKPKAPKDSLKIEPVIDENGAYVDADVTVYLLCPNCGEMVGIDENVDKFCHECGQAIQWDNLEGTEDENT